MWSALPLVMVRAAALPREAYPRLQPAQRDGLLGDLWAEPALAEAVRLANPLVAEHIDRHLAGAVVARPAKRRRLENTLVNYANRMTSRATPYGLFAGVGFTTWSGPTDVPAEPQVVTSRRLVRPSEYAIAKEIVAVEAAGQDLSLVVETNPTRHVRHGRIHFHSPLGVQRSVRRSAVLDDLVEFARRPCTLDEVVGRAQELSAPEPMALARQLLAAGLLLSSLRSSAPHPLPSDMFVRQAAEQGRANQLQTAELVMTFSGAAPDTLRRTLASALPILQRVAAARAPDGSLGAYAQQFVARFSHEEVPLLDVVDRSVGLGPLPPIDHRAAGEAAHRHDALCRLVLRRAARNGGLQASIEAADVVDIAVADDQRVGSVDVFVRSVADGHPAGGWVIGPRGVVGPGGRAFARFGHLDARVAEHVRAAVEDDIQAHRNLYFVTIDHWQDSMRDLATGCAPGDGLLIWSSAASTSTANLLLRPSELLVGHCDGRLVLRSRLDGALVVARPHHLVDTADAPAAIDLVHRISAGASVAPKWSWAASAQFLPMLPRVCIGDLVVSPARWRLDLTATDSTGAVARWREESGVPRLVETGLHDQRLLLDLDKELHRELLAREWQHGLRWVEESLGNPRPPAGFRGRVTEFVATMIEPRTPSRPQPTSRPRPTHVERDSASTVDTAVRLPGDGWWSFHIRPAEDGADRVLTAIDQYAARRDVEWFFARLDDPEEHIRVRARGKQFQVSEFCTLLRLLSQRDELVDFTIQPYYRELQRYGGEALLTQCEELFCADSSLAVEGLPLFAQLRDADVDPVVLAAAVTQLYLTALGLRDSAMDEVLAIMTQRSAGKPPPIRARRRENDIAALLPRLILSPDAPAPSWIRELAESYASPVSGDLAAAEPEIVRSLVHMHLNRRAVMPADEHDGAAALRAVRRHTARRRDSRHSHD